MRERTHARSLLPVSIGRYPMWRGGVSSRCTHWRGRQRNEPRSIRSTAPDQSLLASALRPSRLRSPSLGAYWPNQVILEGDWVPPKVERVKIEGEN
jgi:hypothetical protein